jgi:short-subunit dehydrogenase
VRVAEHVATSPTPRPPARRRDDRRAHPGHHAAGQQRRVALRRRFDQVDAAQFDAVMAVNFHAVVTMTRALLPVLTAHPGVAPRRAVQHLRDRRAAGQTAYCASKFAVRGFLESLRGELAPSGVGVTCVHPGGVRTNIARNAIVGDPAPGRAVGGGPRPFDRLLTLDPADAAETILRAVHRRRPRVLVGRDAVVSDKLARLLPVGNGRLLSAATRSGPPLTRCRTDRRRVSTPAVRRGLPASGPADHRFGRRRRARAA